MKTRLSFFVLLALLLAAPGLAQAQTATLVFPANGATNANLTQPIQWTAVSGAQAYVLWVGTTVGAKDLVNTPEIQQTSFLASNLPAGPTMYARMWTKFGGVWRSVDSTFTVASTTATITTPANGATQVNPLTSIQWTSVVSADAYVVWVGTSVGASNVVYTPQLSQTSYQPAAAMPSSQTLYARMWTHSGGVWRSVDSTFTTGPLTTSITAPANGATQVSPTTSIQWSSVPYAQAYVIWLGTTAGAHDLVTSPETQQTSYQPTAALPANQIIYARMWTKVGGVWRSVDSTFTTAPITATLTTPANGATGVSTQTSFQWGSVTGAQAYVVWVGTTAGAHDIITTPETQQTSYQPGAALPANQTLYARMWTKYGGVWRSVDSTFTTAPITTTLTTPSNGATLVSPITSFQWTSVLNAQAYVLWVGTTLGTHNVINTPEIQQTTYQPAAPLAANQTLYARAWVKVGGVWRSTDSTFTTGALVATLIYPVNGAQGVDNNVPASWTSVPNAEAYELYIGSSLGASDYLNGPQTQDTSYPISSVVPNRMLYARLWTKVGGVWRYSESTFTIAPIVPEFTAPADGAIGVDGSQAFTWTTALAAQAYKLQIGTAPGATDVADSGEIAGTSYVVAGLAQTGPLYARVWVKVGGQWKYHNDIGFTLDGSVAPATISIPSDGEPNFWTARPFQWADVPLARGYRLQVGTVPGGNDLHDSGEIHVTSRFVTGLPLGQTLYGRLQTKIGGQWSSTDFTFTATSSTPSTTLTLKAAFDATDFVRNMAASDLHPNGWTELYTYVWPRYFDICSDFAPVLRQVLAEMNIAFPSRILNVAFDNNHYDTHQLVELWNPDQNDWMLLDPTFDLTAKNSDDTYATAADMAQATATFDWAGISYQFFGTAGDQYARNYYLDYPLLFLNPTPIVRGDGPSPLPYLQTVTVPSTGSSLYLVRCTASDSTTVIVDGTPTVVACDGVDGLSKVFGASSIDAPSGPLQFELYQPKRFVF